MKTAAPLLLLALAACTPDPAQPVPQAEGPARPPAARQAAPVAPAIAEVRTQEEVVPNQAPEQAEGDLRDLVPAAATVWIECTSLDRLEELALAAEDLGAPFAVSVDDLVAQVELYGGRARSVRRDEAAALAVTHRGPDRASQWSPVLPVQQPRAFAEGLRIAPGQGPAASAGTWVTLPGNAALARRAEWLDSVPEADLCARVRVDRLRALGHEPLAVLHDLCGPASAGLLAFPGLLEELREASRLDLLLWAEEGALTVELRFDGVPFGASSGSPTEAPSLEQLDACHGLALAGTLSGPGDPLARCAALWTPAVGEALEGGLEGPTAFTCGVDGTPGAARLVLAAQGADLAGWQSGLREAVAASTLDENAALALTEPRSREGAFGSFTQADLVPRAGTRQQEATDLLVGTFGTTRARARLATTSCALLFGLGEAPVSGEAEPHEGFRSFEPREDCDAWLRLCLERAFVEDAPPLVGACAAAALFDAIPAPFACVQAERAGTERRVSVRWSARP